MSAAGAVGDPDRCSSGGEPKNHPSGRSGTPQIREGDPLTPDVEGLDRHPVDVVVRHVEPRRAGIPEKEQDRSGEGGEQVHRNRRQGRPRHRAQSLPARPEERTNALSKGGRLP
ncbi:hypothetical protein AKJ09_03396 [Labilithrix luteola]|uniref:Uncharacterized protein n=1 Tax=Labilithrix luteola TaxID=1391654 RepID=A0A0K1PTA1_9BACT|nr:hypothetical protein AKJ09_03396 [Labilithrix luteola]